MHVTINASIRFQSELIRWKNGSKNGNLHPNKFKNSIEACMTLILPSMIRMYSRFNLNFSKYFDFYLEQMHYNFYLNYLVLIQKKVHWKLEAMLLSMWFPNVFRMCNDEFVFRCIVSSINDPNVYVMDHLLLLEPVKILEGEPIHKVNFDVFVLFSTLF